MLPSRRRAINERSRRVKDVEDSMNQQLEDLGLLEQGMTFKDKEDLLNIVRMSENTAQAEEDERKSKVTGISSPGISNQREEVMLENGEGEEREPVENDLEITQVYFPSDVVMKLSNSLDKSSKPNLSAGVEDPKSSSKENQKSYSLSLEADSVEDDDVLTYEENKSENEKNHLLKGETCVNQTISDNFSSLSSDKEQEHTVPTQQDHNREKSLNVFSYNQEPFLKTFCRNKLRKAQERIPFYLLHRNMDVNKYTNFFKCYVNEYLRRLYRNQRRRLEHLEWGPPICMEDSSVSDFKKQKLREESDSSRRYNFRDRLVKPKIIDFASENSEAEEESNDEDIFTPKNKKLPGIKLSSKRKISSMSDVISPKKERKDLSSVFESKKLQGSSVGDLSSKIELQHEETSTINTNDVGSCGVFSKRVPRTKLNLTTRKRNRRQGLSSSSQVKDDTELTENADITSTTELDVPVSRDEENIEPCQENEMNVDLKPAALSAKHKKVLMTYDKSIRPLRRKTEVENSRDEFSYLTDSETPSQDLEPRIPCPICRSLFPAKCIEAHASDCNQYHSDISANSTELNSNK